MKPKNVSEVLDMLSSMDYEKRDKLSYFAMGMLYGLSVLEVDDDAIVTLKDSGEEDEA